MTKYIVMITLGLALTAFAVYAPACRQAPDEQNFTADEVVAFEQMAYEKGFNQAQDLYLSDYLDRVKAAKHYVDLAQGTASGLQDPANSKHYLTLSTMTVKFLSQGVDYFFTNPPAAVTPGKYRP